MTENQGNELIRLVKSLTRTVDDMKIALEGNTRLGIEGAIKKLTRHDRWINRMELRMAMWGGVGATVAFIGEQFLKWIVK